MRARLMSGTVMLTVTAGAVVLWAAPPVKNLAATAAFRSADDDAVKSSPITGAIGNGIFNASVASPADFGTQIILPAYLDDTRECLDATLAKCNPAEQSGMLDLATFQVGIKAVLNNEPDFDDRPGGLTGMACTSSSDALVNYTFYIPNTQGHWGLNANRRYHADHATVVRTSRTTWVVTAVGRAELVSFAHSNIARKSGPSHEGQYILPFQITITASNAPPCG